MLRGSVSCTLSLQQMRLIELVFVSKESVQKGHSCKSMMLSRNNFKGFSHGLLGDGGGGVLKL